jgi:hypothetical protein
VYARLLRRNVLCLSTARLEPEMLLKCQVALLPVPSAAVRSKTGTCERGLEQNKQHSRIRRLQAGCETPIHKGHRNENGKIIIP